MGQQKHGKILAMAYESNTGPVGFVLNKNVPKTTNQPYTGKKKAEQIICPNKLKTIIHQAILTGNIRKCCDFSEETTKI